MQCTRSNIQDLWVHELTVFLKRMSPYLLETLVGCSLIKGLFRVLKKITKQNKIYGIASWRRPHKPYNSLGYKWATTETILVLWKSFKDI